VVAVSGPNVKTGRIAAGTRTPDRRRMAAAGHTDLLITGVLFLAFAVALLAPTSVGGERLGSSFTAAKLLAIYLLVLVAHLWSGTSRRGFFFSIASVAYLSMATYVTAFVEPNMQLNWVRMLVSVCAASTLALAPVRGVSAISVRRMLDFVVPLIGVVGLATLLKFPPVLSILNSYYTQLDTYTATYYSTLIGKPVFTFGASNIAASFYLGIFLVAGWTYNRVPAKRLRAYQVVLLGLTVLCFSNAALLVAALMVALLAYDLNRHSARGRKLAQNAAIGGIITVGAYLLAERSDFLSRYTSVLSSSANGWVARYSSESDLFAGNFRFVEGHGWGLGWCTPTVRQDLYFSDSGYLINYLMGGAYYVALFYAVVLVFVFQGGNRRESVQFLLAILVSELSIVTFHYEKTILLILILHIARSARAPSMDPRDGLPGLQSPARGVPAPLR